MGDGTKSSKGDSLGKNMLGLTVLSTNREQEGKVFLIGAVIIKDSAGNTVDEFAGRCPTKEKHPYTVNIHETHRDFYHLVEDFSEFCKKHPDIYIIILDSTSIEFIFVEQLILYSILKDIPEILIEPVRRESPMTAATLMGIKMGEGDKGDILFVPEFTIKLVQHILLNGSRAPLPAPALNMMLTHPTVQ